MMSNLSVLKKLSEKVAKEVPLNEHKSLISNFSKNMKINLKNSKTCVDFLNKIKT